MIFTDEVKGAIALHAERDYPRECCGFIIIFRGRQTYFPGRNNSAGDSHFCIDPNDYAEAHQKGEIVAVVHSHPDTTPDPSEADLVACEASGLTWLIVSYPDLEWRTVEPPRIASALVGREWLHGSNDCYGLVRDWYAQEMNLNLPDFSREDDWWHTGQNLYLDNFAACGFDEIPASEIRRGDLLFFKIGAPVPNHAAIYLGDGMIIHHLHSRLSCREPLTGSYMNRLTHYLRYNGSL